jgi:thiol-disulfide isomerase/thioredoxin
MTRSPWPNRLLKVAGAVVALYIVSQAISPHGASLAAGTDAPSLRLTSLDGETVDLATLRGRVVVLNFFATWCPPCRAEIPDLSRFQREHPEVVVVGVATESGDAAALRAFAAERAIAYRVVLGDDGVLGRYGVSVLPTTYVLDREGRVGPSFVGAVSRWRLTRAVGKLAAPPAQHAASVGRAGVARRREDPGEVSVIVDDEQVGHGDRGG